jgi:hypothetical protein
LTVGLKRRHWGERSNCQLLKELFGPDRALGWTKAERTALLLKLARTSLTEADEQEWGHKEKQDAIAKLGAR